MTLLHSWLNCQLIRFASTQVWLVADFVINDSNRISSDVAGTLTYILENCDCNKEVLQHLRILYREFIHSLYILNCFMMAIHIMIWTILSRIGYCRIHETTNTVSDWFQASQFNQLYSNWSGREKLLAAKWDSI